MDIEAFLKKIISVAIEYNASDLHISPKDKSSIFFRYRLSGVLTEGLVQEISFLDYKILASQIVSKASSNPGSYLCIANNTFNFKNKWIDASINVSMMPTEYLFEDGRHCPMFVLKIHNNADDASVGLTDLGISDYHYNILIDIIRFNQGLVIATGPKGSGKTTVLYALIDEISKECGRSIQTLENPIERNLPRVDQFAINESAGINYSSGLTALSQQDADVMLIGEIEDEVSARKTTELSMTGHLVLSAMRSNTALQSIGRLELFNVSPSNIADVLKSVIATRLVRELCIECSVSADMSNSILEPYRDLIDRINDNVTNRILESSAEGCQRCDFTGYRDTVLVLEILTMDINSQVMIAKNTPIIQIEKYLVDHGQKTLWHHGIELLLQGRTSLKELINKLPFYNGHH